MPAVDMLVIASKIKVDNPQIQDFFFYQKQEKWHNWILAPDHFRITIKSVKLRCILDTLWLKIINFCPPKPSQMDVAL